MALRNLSKSSQKLRNEFISITRDYLATDLTNCDWIAKCLGESCNSIPKLSEVQNVNVYQVIQGYIVKLQAKSLD